MEDWWTGIEREVHECLERHGELTPAELGCYLGISETATASLLALLSASGQVRIARVAPLAKAGAPHADRRRVA